ncbi:MAG TPA: serine/threonine protein kinase [Polyangiaceae bacterium]|nr:serine/threonine protein kinase [Polyangiaceae bacterium]
MMLSEVWRDDEASRCPDEAQLASFVEGTLAPELSREVELHVDACSRCDELLATFAKLFISDDSDGVTGSVIGRYHVEELLGAGGMAVVYRARDPELGRPVALKLVRADDDARAQASHARMLREARALARLSHPNVVPAFDVGRVGDRFYIAMEYVDGEPLDVWLTGEHGYRQRLDVLLQAGRGLVAAHQVGLVHRDFKPSNVVVGSDGRVRVLDFGLARQALHDAPRLPAVSGSMVTDVTRTGTLMGTPAYMAPEQLRGERADARSDQFAFAVTACEVLFGQRPFDGASLEQLERQVLAGEASLPAGRVPRAVRAALLRALEPEPDRRFESLAALLHALEGAPVDTRPVDTRAPLVVVALLVASVALLAWLFTRPEPGLLRQARPALPAIVATPPPRSSSTSAANLAAPAPPPSSSSTAASATSRHPSTAQPTGVRRRDRDEALGDRL